VALITLTTDFGTRDPYVAAMKGVIASRLPGAVILDLSHEIGPQDVPEAALFVAGSAPWFPEGTVHAIVVDPGVGTERKPLAARIGASFYVAPDNGVLSLVADQQDGLEAFEIVHPGCRLDTVSTTFHGRDLFAPTAAALAAGMALTEVGPPIDAPVRLDWPEPALEKGRLDGEVVHVDRFGNAITNLRRADLPGDVDLTVQAQGRSPLPLQSTYGQCAPGALLSLVGSSGYIEIAVNGGSAARELGIGRGARVTVCWEDAG
jgi:hypothetical protein